MLEVYLNIYFEQNFQLRPRFRSCALETEKMGLVDLAIILVAVSDCGVKRVETDPSFLSGSRCFDWNGADAKNASLKDIYAIYQRLGNLTKSDLKIVNPVSNWDSARLVSVVVNIIQREIMGYDTELDFIGSTGMLYKCVADGTHTFNIETWINTKADQRAEWVVDKVR